MLFQRKRGLLDGRDTGKAAGNNKRESGETECGRVVRKTIDRDRTDILLCSYIPGKIFPGDHFGLVQPKFSGKVYCVERDT